MVQRGRKNANRDQPAEARASSHSQSPSEAQGLELPSALVRRLKEAPRRALRWDIR